MIDDIFVIEGISHLQEMRADKILPPGQVLRDLNIELSQSFPREVVPPGADAWDALPTADHICNATFLESHIDLAVTHHLPLYSYMDGGLVSIEANKALVDRAPQRWIAYAGVDPTAGVEQAIESLEHQMELIPQTVGLKMYPAQLDPLRSLYLDDESYFPIWRRAQELGIKVIAIHKALPYGPVPINPFKVDDVEGVASAFPDMMFEVIHGGMAFTTETAMMIGRYPNVYTNLEGTTIYEYLAPGRFENALAELMFYDSSSPRKIIWGTGGAHHIHPQFFLDRFLNFEFSEAVMERWGLGQITMEQKADMLGRNYARMIGLDIDKAKEAISDDEYSRAVAADGLAAPYSTWSQITPDSDVLEPHPSSVSVRS